MQRCKSLPICNFRVGPELENQCLRHVVDIGSFIGGSHCERRIAGNRFDDIDAIEPVTGLTVLGMAAQNETANAYDLLVPLVSVYRADVDAADRNGFMHLHYAAPAGNLFVVEFLKTRGAEPIDSKTRADLELQAKVQEALNAFYDSSSRRPPEGVNRQEWKRQRYNDSYDEAVMVLRDSGRCSMRWRIRLARGVWTRRLDTSKLCKLRLLTRVEQPTTNRRETAQCTKRKFGRLPCSRRSPC